MLCFRGQHTACKEIVFILVGLAGAVRPQMQSDQVPPNMGRRIIELDIATDKQMLGRFEARKALFLVAEDVSRAVEYRTRIQRLQSQASARARRKAFSRALRVSVAAAVNSERASASRPARNRKSPLAAGNGA